MIIISKEIKIFYSWQSDLPGNKSRYIIQESIEDAVKKLKDTIKVEADRDTKNEYGSPDIVQTIFSKIDESDLFIADVSVINKYTSLIEEEDKIKQQEDHNDIKLSPNPNVLLELGYAAKTLGWDRVICIINTDFGEIERLPFDIAHRRLTPFSLNQSSKSNVKKQLSGILVDTINEFIKSGKSNRVKGNFPMHMVGCYDFKTEKVLEEIPTIKVRSLKNYESIKETMLLECIDLIGDISNNDLDLPDDKKELGIAKEKVKDKHNDILNPLEKRLSSVNGNSFVESLFQPQIVKVENDDKDYVKEKVYSNFDINLEESFFCMGNLTSKFDMLLQESTNKGTKNEKRKYDDFIALLYNFKLLDLLDQYVDTFNSYILIPLAITNDSNHNDVDVSVSIKVDVTTAKIILPNAKLLNDKIAGLEGFIYESNFIEQLFTLPQTDKIHYDSDIPFDVMEDLRRIQKTNILGQTSYDSEDYEIELKKYIATPVEYDNSVFEYNLKGLRPKETKWLGSSILVKPQSDKIKLSYSIKSSNSNGELAGDIVIVTSSKQNS